MIQDVYIVSAVRTPIASFRGSFSTLSSSDLGAVAATEAIKKAGFSPSDIEETITGSVLTAGQGQNVSRQIALKCDIPEDRNAFTVNKVCSSSLKALIIATQAIQLSYRQKCLVVGTESMSQTPRYLTRDFLPYGNITALEGIERDGIWDAFLNKPMGLCAEKTVKDYNITRNEQDEYAISSYERASNSWRNNEFANEIVSVIVKQPRGPDIVVSEDEEYKRLVKEKISTLPAVFIKDGTGTITAANASSLNDGACALIVASENIVKKQNLKPLAKIISYTEAGCLPIDFTIAPVKAVTQLLKTTQIPKEKIARWEVNEAFSVTVLSFIKELKIDRNIVNSKGGAVAIGHPIGMSGARIVTTLIYQLQPGELGVATICNGGGEATAILIKRC